MDKALYISDIIKLLKKKLKWLMLGLLVTIPLTIIVTKQMMTPIYQSRVELIVSPTASSQQLSTNQLKTISDLMRTFQTIILSDNIISKAKEDLALDITNDALREKIGVRFGADTQAFDLLINDASPEQAQSIAQAMSAIIQEDLLKYYESNLTIREISPAKTTTQPISPSLRNNLLAAIFFTGLIWILAVILIELINPYLKSSRYLESFGWANLGSLQTKTLSSLGNKGQTLSSHHLEEITRNVSKNMNHEEIELIRVKIEHELKALGEKTVLVTSPSNPSSSARLAAQIAESWALEGKRVALVDGNFRHPLLHKIFNIQNDEGLTLYMADDLIQVPSHQSFDNLSIFTAGPTYAEPAELWSSHRVSQFLTFLDNNYDWVIFETASFHDYVDTKILSLKVPRILVATTLNVSKLNDIRELALFAQKYEMNVMGFVTEEETQTS